MCSSVAVAGTRVGTVEDSASGQGALWSVSTEVIPGSPQVNKTHKHRVFSVDPEHGVLLLETRASAKNSSHFFYILGLLCGWMRFKKVNLSSLYIFFLLEG